MSVTDSAFEDLIIHWYSIDVSVSMEVSSTALYLFDYLLTLPQEINNIWRCKTTTATVLFLLNRYLFMISRCFRLIQVASWKGWFGHTADRICNISWRLSEICLITTYIIVVMFATLRVFAIWGRNFKIFVCVLGVGLICPITNGYYVTTLVFSAFPPPLTGCRQHTRSFMKGLNVDEVFFFVGTAAATLFECMIIILTWMKTASIQRSLQSIGGAQRPRGLSYMLLRQGFIHFVIIMVLDVTNCVAERVEAVNNSFPLTDTLVSILVSRFILDLRDKCVFGEVIASRSLHFSHIDSVHLASPQTSRLIGNLGGSLEFFGDEEENIGEDDDNESFVGLDSADDTEMLAKRISSWPSSVI